MDVLNVDDLGKLEGRRGLFRRASVPVARKTRLRVRKGKTMEQATEIGVNVIETLNLTPTPVIITAVARETVKQVPVRRRVRKWWSPWTWFQR